MSVILKYLLISLLLCGWLPRAECAPNTKETLTDEGFQNLLHSGQVAQTDELYERLLRARNIDPATLRNIGDAYRVYPPSDQPGRDHAYNRARVLYRRALVLLNKKKHEDRVQVLEITWDLAELDRRQEKARESIALARTAWRFAESKMVAGSDEYLLGLHHLGHMYIYFGMPSRARRLYEEQLAGIEARFGKDDLAVVSVLSGFGSALKASGDQHKAAEQFSKAIEILDRGYQSDVPHPRLPLLLYPALAAVRSHENLSDYTSSIRSSIDWSRNNLAK